MTPEILVQQLRATKEYFDRSTKCLTEADSGYAPAAGLMTVAQQVAHVAQTVEWFYHGAFRPAGFDLDFEKHGVEVAKVTSLDAARDWLDRAFAEAVKATRERSAEEWSKPLPPGPVMGGQPRSAIVDAIGDHSAHHRGALTVYSRLCGHEPAMPYM